jgi:hypothetical protein
MGDAPRAARGSSDLGLRQRAIAALVAYPDGDVERLARRLGLPVAEVAAIARVVGGDRRR